MASVVYSSIGETLTRYDLDVESAVLEKRESVTLPSNVQYVWPHPSKKYLYVASSTRGPAGPGHYLSAFRIGASGALTEHGKPIALTHRPIHMSVDRAGRYVLTAYSAPSAVTVHQINDDRTIGADVKQRAGLDFGIYAHQVLETPSNRTVILVTRGHDETPAKGEEPGALKLFSFNDGMLANKQSIAPNGGYGFGPRHLDFHPARSWVYVSLERQNLLQMFPLDANGKMPEQALFSKTILAKPNDVRRRQLGGTVHVHPNGRFVYVANRNDTTEEYQGKQVFRGGENSIAVFAIDPTTGEPKLIQHVDPQSLHVRTFSIDPTGELMLASSIHAVRVRKNIGVMTVPCALSMFRIAEDGKLKFVRKYDIDVGDKLQWWTGIVGL